MTNKTEMVSVPRELLLRLLSVYSASPYPAWHELAAALEAAPAEDVRAVAPAIDFNEEILLPCPPGVRPGFCGDVKLSFDGAEYRGRVWLMEQGGKEEWVAIEGPENARKAGEALIAWAEAWEGQDNENRPQ